MADDGKSPGAQADLRHAVTMAHGAPAFLALKSGLAMRHYIIDEVIGAGGFGITYRAHHERLTSKVFALKEFFPRDYASRHGTEVVSTPDGQGIFRWGLDRFLKEAEALSRCHHTGIVDVVDYFEANGTAYAVLGYVEGQQMGHWLSGLGRPPTQAELDRILDPLLEALETVHGARLLHRDIAPDNILIKTNGLPCLIDFGACREDIRERSQKVSAIVKHGYSPPEQYHGLAELQGPWSDIYSLGATLYRAVAGVPPMDSSRRGALGDSLKPVAEMATAEYRPQFLAAIDMALRLKPEERPQSVADWRAMLFAREAALAAVPPLQPPRTEAAPHTGPGSPPAPVPVKTWPRWALPGAIGLAVLAMLGMAVAFTPSRQDPEATAQTAWAAIAATADPAVVERFIRDYGTTKAAGPARERLAALTAEKGRQKAEEAALAAWQRIAGSGSVADIERFLAQFPNASVSQASRDRLAALKAEADRTASSEAREREAVAAWAKLKASDDAAAIERFLNDYGSTRIAADARARLSILGLASGHARELDELWNACKSAPAGQRTTPCSKVVDGNDSLARQAEALQLRGVDRRNAGDNKSAISDLTASLLLRPRDGSVHNDRGIAYLLDNDRARALRDFDDAISFAPLAADPRNNRAWLLYLEGRLTDALGSANTAISLSPGNANAYDTRGHIYEGLGRRDEAIRDYTKALELDRNQAESAKGLDRLKAKR